MKNNSILIIMRLLPRKQKYFFVLLIFLMVIVALFETLATALMLPLMNTIMSRTTSHQSDLMTWLYNFLNTNDNHQLIIKLTFIIAIIYLVKGFMTYINNALQQKFVANNRNILANKLFKSSLNKPYSFHLNNTTSDMQRAVITDVEWFCFFVNAFMTMVAEGLMLLIMSLALMIINPYVTVSTILFLLGVVVFVTAIVSKKVRNAGEKNRIQNVAMLKWVQQTIGGLKSILISNRREYFENHFKTSVKEYALYNCEYQTIFAVPRIIMESVNMAGIFSLMAILMLFNLEVETILPMLATFAIAAVRLIPSAKRVSDSLNQMKYYLPSIENITNNIDFKLQENSIIKDQIKVPTDNLGENIKIENITFSFPGAKEPLYKDFSLVIPFGKSTAFIGTTGSGKTTLADIILGLHQLEKGSVKINDINIAQCKNWWASQVGYIPQNIYLCDDTIKSNVAFGIEESEVNEELVWNALKEAQIDEFIKTLPEGLLTHTGENGIRLSGGQRQRIGIARALYSNPKILVLDEATSALDNETEKAIMEAIDFLSKSKTLIIIAHRLTTIEKCDYIYKIENGKAELLTK